MKNDKAVAAYAAKIEEVRMRLEALGIFVKDFGCVSPDEVQWADVGSASYIAFRLGEVMAFLGIKED